MGENQRTSLCNKSTLKTSNPDTDCLPCLSVNVKAKTNLKPNSSNGKLGNCDGNNCPLRWWRLKASGERAAGGFLTSRDFFVIFTILFKMLQTIITSKLQKQNSLLISGAGSQSRGKPPTTQTTIEVNKKKTWGSA